MVSSNLAGNEATAGRGGAMDLEADNLHQQVGVLACSGQCLGVWVPFPGVGHDRTCEAHMHSRAC